MNNCECNICKCELSDSDATINDYLHSNNSKDKTIAIKWSYMIPVREKLCDECFYSIDKEIEIQDDKVHIINKKVKLATKTYINARYGKRNMK